MLKPSETELRDFILRRMPPEAASLLEDTIVLEEGVAESLRSVEFDLLDDYAASRLAPADRADVERWLLTTAENRDRLRMAGSLRRERSRLAAAPPAPAGKPRVTGLRRALAGGTGALLAAGIAAVLLVPRWHNAPAPLLTEHAAASRSQATTPQLGYPIVTLLAETNRGASRPELHWPAQAGAIRLQVEIPDTSREPETEYTLQLNDVDGKALFMSGPEPMKVAGPYRFVDVTVPSSALGPGPRTITLRRALQAPEAPPMYAWQVTGAPD